MREPGSGSLDHLFLRAAESQELQLFFSAWNVGEVLGILDERHRKKLLADNEYSSAIFNFSDETLRMTRRGSIQILSVAGKLLTASWRILLEEEIYEADALQIASCKEADGEHFVTADRRLLEAAERQGLNALDPARDERRLASL